MIVEDLFKLKDEKFKEFSSRLLPNIEKSKIIGVKKPKIEQYFKTLSEQQKINFINQLPHKYLEENLLHGIILSNMNVSFEEVISLLNKFLPYVDNWEVCDLIKIRQFKLDIAKTKINIEKWIKSSHEYTVRFGIVSLMKYCLDGEFNKNDLILIANISNQEFYVKMAKAWYFSFALIKQYNQTIKIFKNKVLDKFTHNKSIQKAVESCRITEEKKKYLKTLKI